LTPAIRAIHLSPNTTISSTTKAGAAKLCAPSKTKGRIIQQDAYKNQQSIKIILKINLDAVCDVAQRYKSREPLHCDGQLYSYRTLLLLKHELSCDTSSRQHDHK
jgi:hypothetical protein